MSLEFRIVEKAENSTQETEYGSQKIRIPGGGDQDSRESGSVAWSHV